MRRSKVTASVDLLNILLHFASSRGLDMGKIKAATEQALEKRSDSRIPIKQLDAVWKEIVRQSDDPNFGLHLGEAADQQTSGGILFSVMMNCATVGNALEKQIRYHALSTDLIQLRLQEQGKYVRYIWEEMDSEIELDRHYIETVFCGVVFPLRRLTQNKVRPVEIHFKYPKPADISEHQRIFDCSLRFDCLQNELILPCADLAQPIFLANPQLLDQLEAFAQEMLIRLYPPDTWSDRVGHSINKSLLRGEKPALDSVAYELALSPRQLQNKLRQEGTTYQVLLDQIRRETALKYLNESDITICDIAFLLGFSEQSAFNHAFKRWTGANPGDYRKTSQPARTFSAG
ncbi:MAG: AraC family transcriptional regulator [Chloroflexota bacterium]|nr:AraC family transcriptional regulator [Anaerolineales bacterium]